MRWVLGVWLVASFVLASCYSDASSESECSPGDARECTCTSGCGTYVGCGACLSAAIGWTSTATCDADGRWGSCECAGPLEPECRDGESPQCAGRCSETLRAILREMPADRDEGECRAAFRTYAECLGPCDEPAMAACEAEVLAMDRACLEEPPSTCP